MNKNNGGFLIGRWGISASGIILPVVINPAIAKYGEGDDLRLHAPPAPMSPVEASDAPRHQSPELSPASPQESATDCLKRLMRRADLPSYRSLSQRAGVSKWVLQQLRQGRIQHLRLDTLQAIATALHLSLADFLGAFGGLGIADMPPATAPADEGDRVAALTAEYQRLQTQLAQQAAQTRQDVQREALALIEPWLLQWPTVAHAVQQNPDLPASRVVPLVHPLQALLEAWEVRAIAAVGAVVAYDPQQHQLMTGEAAPGDPVKVRYAGFWQRDTLLHRAKVSRVED